MSPLWACVFVRFRFIQSFYLEVAPAKRSVGEGYPCLVRFWFRCMRSRGCSQRGREWGSWHCQTSTRAQAGDLRALLLDHVVLVRNLFFQISNELGLTVVG